MLRKVAVWVVVCLLLVGASAVVGGFYLTKLALRPAVERDTEACYARFVENYPTLQGWADTLLSSGRLRPVMRTAEDGTQLEAWVIAADEPTDCTAVVVHGYTDHPFGMLQIAWIYHKHLGYNVLLPTLRYHGASGGEAIQMGWGDRLDVKEWIHCLPQLFGAEQRVVVHGISMGAATTMMLAGEADVPTAVRCYVEDCGYTSVWEQFCKELREDYHLPPFPILYVANCYCRLRYGWDFREASALDAVARAEAPMLFIHGEEDHYVPTAMVYPLYEHKSGVKELWVAPGSGHAWAFADHAEEYVERVCDFVSRYI